MTLDFKDKTLDQKYKFLVEFTCLFNKLRPKEKEVLSRILFYQKDLNYDVLKDYEVKVKIREDVNISEHNFNNIIASLKKKNVVKNNKLTDVYRKLIDSNKIDILF